LGSLKGSQTTQQTTAASPQATAAYSQLLGQAQNVASTPYQAYTGELTAPVNSQQQAGIGGINAAAGQAQPAINQALGIAGAAANPLTAQQIQNYQNPYTQDVVNATQAQFNNQNQQGQEALTGNNIAAGALGGNRSGIASANLANQQQLAQAPTIAGLYSNSYNQGLATAAQQYQQNPLAAAGSIANFGVSGENAALSGAGAQLGAGTLEQQTQQAADTANYGQYAQAQAYPFQTEQWLAGLEGAVAPGLGATSTTVGPPPNTTAQYLGAGVAGAGLALSDRRAKKNVHKVGSLNDGQPIYRYQYNGSDEWHIGPIAQEVEKHQPHAVHEGVGGVKYVDLKAATEDSIRRASGGVVSDADPEGVSAGQQYAQSSPYQIRPNQDGTHSVINVRTGQIHFTGTPSGAQNAQSSLNYRNRASGGGVGGTPWSSAQGWVPTFSGVGSTAPHASGPSNPTAATPNINWAQLGNTKANPNGPLADSPTYGGGNMLTDAGGGSSSNPLPGLDASDYGAGFWSGGGVGRARFADGGSPSFDDRFVGGDDPSFADRFAPASDSPFVPMTPSQGVATRSMGPPAPDVYDDGQGPVRLYGDRPSGDETSLQGTGVAANPSGKPVVASSDDDEDETPVPGKSAVGPSGGVVQPPGTYSADVDQAPYKALGEPSKGLGIGFGLISPNAQSGLLAAGLGMLASRSPFLGNAIGEGGAAGLTAFNAGEEHDRKIAAEAQKLSQEAKKEADDLALRKSTQAETARHNIATEKTAASNADRTKFLPIGSTVAADGSVHPLVMDQTTAKIIDGLTGKTPAADSKFVGKNDKGAPVPDEDAKAIAERYVKTGDRTQLQGLGVSGQARQKVNHYIGEVQKELKVSDEELGQRVAEFEGRKAGQRTLGTQEAKMGSAAFEAEGAIKQARGVIERLPRTSFLPFNKLIQGYQSNTLNPDQAELAARTQAIINTYSAVMARGANVTTDSSRHHAEALLNTAGDPETYNRTLDTMLQEINMAKGSPERMRQFYRQQYGPTATGEATPAGGAATPPAFTPPAGAIPRTFNGKTYYYDPQTKQPLPGQ
jgi:hypothetical protein